MLRITNSFSGKEATRYYGAALGQTDYYARTLESGESGAG
jgi:hypothetical protein